MRAVGLPDVYVVAEPEPVLGPWSEHGTSWYSCNRYDEKASVDARDAQTRSRASLERYLHVSLQLHLCIWLDH